MSIAVCVRFSRLIMTQELKYHCQDSKLAVRASPENGPSGSVS